MRRKNEKVYVPAGHGVGAAVGAAVGDGVGAGVGAGEGAGVRLLQRTHHCNE